MVRLVLGLLILAAMVAVPFAIWGDAVEAKLSVEAAVAWLRASRWAALAVVALHAADILLPVPSTALTTAMGVVYGPVIGGLMASAGALLGAAIGYWLCRAMGPQTAKVLAGKDGLVQARALFDRWGLALIAASRWVPVLPETMAFLCGLLRLNALWFLGAVALGAVPKAFIFAWLGHVGRETPVLVIALGVALPIAVMIVVDLVRRARQSRTPT